jgi:hypothetical protein
MDAALTHGGSLEDRRARYNRHAKSRLVRHQFQGDAVLGFALHKENPDARFSTLPALGPLQMIAGYVKHAGPVLCGYRKSVSVIYKHTLEHRSPTWTAIHKDPNVEYVTSFRRKELLVFVDVDITAGPESYFAYRLSRNSEVNEFEANHTMFSSVDYEQQCFANISTFTSPSATVELQNFSIAFSATTDIDRVSRQRRNCLAYLSTSRTLFCICHSRVRVCNFGAFLQKHYSWLEAPALNLKDEEVFSAAATADTSGNLLYAIGRDNLFAYDARQPPIWRECSEQELDNCWSFSGTKKLMPYNDGHDVLYYVGHEDSVEKKPFFHFDVRASRWTNTRIPAFTKSHRCLPSDRFCILDEQ